MPDMLMRPLYGLSCAGTPMPPATQTELSMALEDAAVLRASIEKAPAPFSQDNGPAPGQRPDPVPDYTNAPTNAPSMGPRR